MTLFYVRFLRFIAILPFDHRGFASLASRALLVYCFAWSIMHWSTYVTYLINRGKAQTIDSICEVVMVVGIDTRYYLLLWQRRELAALLAECRDIWNELGDEEDRRAVRQFERKARTLFQALLGSCAFINVIYSLTAVYMNIQAARHANETHPAKHVLPYKWYADDNEDFWPGYKINYALQVIMIVNMGTVATTVDSTAPVFIMIAAGYFRALQRCLNRAYDRAMNGDEGVEDTAGADLELATCCRLHQRILNYCANIDAIARTLFFVQLACTGYNMSLIAIKLVGTDPDRYKYVTIGLLHLGQLYICQWAPDHLIDESGAISTAAYRVSFPWMRRRVGKQLLLMITRAQRPVQMTAAGVVNLSLENFGSMLKSIVSFFTVLRNFTA